MAKKGSMQCPVCGKPLAVVDTVSNEDEQEVYRKRKCSGCGNEFYTVEYEVVANDRFMKEVNKWRKTRWNENNAIRKGKNNG